MEKYYVRSTKLGNIPLNAYKDGGAITKEWIEIDKTLFYSLQGPKCAERGIEFKIEKVNEVAEVSSEAKAPQIKIVPPRRPLNDEKKET